MNPKPYNPKPQTPKELGRSLGVELGGQVGEGFKFKGLGLKG